MVFQYTPFLILPEVDLSNKEIVRNADQFQRMLNFLELSPFITFDTETSGTAWYRHACICGIALAGFVQNQLKSFYIPLRHRTGEHQLNFSQIKSGLVQLFKNDRLKIAHNFKFDEHMFRRDDIPIEGKRYDTMIAARLYDENRTAALKDRAVADLGIVDAELYESRVNEEIDKLAKINCMKKTEYKYQYGYSHLPIDLCGIYACFDVEFTTKLYWFYEQFGVSSKYSRVFNTEMDLLGVLCDMEENGMPIDVEYLQNLKSELGVYQHPLEQHLFYHLQIPKFNIASDDELRYLIMNYLGLPLSKITKGGKYAVDKEALKSIENYHPAVKLISEWREAEKLKSTYTNSIIDRLDEDNVLHCDFQQVGTIASRLSCRDPNLQNQPTDNNDRAIKFSGLKLEDGGKDPWSIRRAYKIFDKEWVRLYFDYSQVELRVLAYYSQDPVMVQAYLNNEDIHNRTSLEVFGTTEKAFRRRSKVINFGLSYGMTEYHFAAVENISVEEAKQHLDKFFESYSGIRDFKEGFFQYLRNNNGEFLNLFGRPRRIPDINSGDFKAKGRAERQSIASLIQGSAGELTKESLVRNDRGIKENGWKDLALPVCTIHDELQYDIHVSILPQFCRMVKQRMEDFKEFAPIPIIVDAEYTVTDWSEKKKVVGL